MVRAGSRTREGRGAIHLSDLNIPDGVEVLLDLERTVCSVQLPTKLEVEEEDDEDEEGEEPELVGEAGEDGAEEAGESDDADEE